MTNPTAQQPPPRTLQALGLIRSHWKSLTIAFIAVIGETVAGVTVLMDSRLVNFSKPVNIELNGSTTTRRFTPSLKLFCETLARRADPAFAFSAALQIVKDPTTARLVVAPTTH